MAVKEDIVDEINTLSNYTVRSGEDLIELRDAYQGLVDKLNDVVGSMNESHSKSKRFADLVDSGEVSLDEGSEQLLTRLADTNDDLVSNMGSMRTLYTDIEIADNVLSRVSNTFDDIIDITSKTR